MIVENKKIIFICGAKGSYVRNNIIYKLLSSKNQVKKITSEADHYFLRLPIILIKFLIYPKKNIDYIFVGFLAQPLVICLNFLTNKAIIADMFISLYNTLCEDRKKIKPQSFIGKIIYKIDQKTISISKIIITDTKSHSRYFQNKFDVQPKKIYNIYLGAETDIFFPQTPESTSNNCFTIFYYGSAQPLHGTEIILKAAKLLEKESVNFIIVGPIQKRYKNLILKLRLNNVNFIPWISYNKLPSYINNADVCLGGPFGTSNKADMVITGKTYQFAAMKKPLILGKSIGNNELFNNKKNCLLIPRNNESALAKAILDLKNDEGLRNEIGHNAHQTIINLKQLINI